ncbi:MAG: hypothetical protein MI924_17870 [Chloroflexales bacterium]|nr:hypothetical protein [Chloroflexales bacterium]
MAKRKSGDTMLALSLDQVLRHAGPREAEVLRRCAITRWFDTKTLAVLRGKESGNERVLELLRSYSFVREIAPGRLAYHDQIRYALLEEWLANRPDELRELTHRLAEHFTERIAASQPEHMPQTSQPYRPTWHTIPTGAWELWQREAIYYSLWADAEAGMAKLRSTFAELEANHRLAEAEVLLQVASEAPLNPDQQHWIDYFRARIQRAALRLDNAEQKLEDLLQVADLDPALEARAHRSLGEVYAETGQWARATSLYRVSLTYFQTQKDQASSAETMLLLGDAYRGLGDNSGGWYTSALASPRSLRLLAQIWEWLLGLPFAIIAFFLKRIAQDFPVPQFSAHYQNWLLIRLYNTARNWYRQARAVYQALGDNVGVLKVDQRLAELLLRFGYHDKALQQLEALLQRPEAQDPYRRDWLQCSMADCYLKLGDVGSAQLILANALKNFRALGDIRREAAVLALQGRAAAMSGNAEAALVSYRSSLDRFRALRYTAAREQILFNLRVWRRTLGEDSPVGRQITALIAAEPVKRYVGRFISSYLPLLQVASILALPVMLLLLAYFVPTPVVQSLGNGALSIETFYNPLTALGLLAILIPLYLAAYTLLGLSVVFFLPITRVEREQPDVIVTQPSQITCYDSFGAPIQEMSWTSVRRYYSLNRTIWQQPSSLYSRSFLEDEAGEDLRIDGITSWYDDVQRDIEQRLDAAGNQQVERRDLGYSLLRSKSGVAVVVGAVLLLLFMASENNWIPLLSVLSPTLYTLFYIAALSGILILAPLAYWLAYRPLQLRRTLELSDSWPYIIAVIGALPVFSFLLHGSTLPVAILNVSTFIWGAYMLGEACVALSIPSRKVLRTFVVGLLLVISLIVSIPHVAVIFNETLSRTTIDHVQENHNLSAAEGFPQPVLPSNDVMTAAKDGMKAASEARRRGGEPYSSYISQGNNALIISQYEDAANSYLQAVEVAPLNSPEQALAYYNLALAYQKAGDAEAARRSFEQSGHICAQRGLALDRACRQISQAERLLFSPQIDNDDNDNDDDTD